MDDDREQLYQRAFGDAKKAVPGVAIPEASFSLDEEFDVPPLDEAMLAELERRLADEPAATRDALRRIIDATLTDAEIDALIVKARAALARPRAALDWMESVDGQLRAPSPVSNAWPKFLEGLGKIAPKTLVERIDPGSTRFETKTDWWGWVVNSGWLATRAALFKPKAPFRWAEQAPSLFVYDYSAVAKPTIDVGLFSDFGTGLYHSRFIAHHLAGAPHPHDAAQPTTLDHAIHLGDVYYAGTSTEFAANFEEPLAPLAAKVPLWTLNANHEMYSKGGPYFRYIDKRRATWKEVQKQEGSYFALVLGGKFQIVGIDTAYHRDGRHHESDLAYWLDARLRWGKDRGYTNILLSSNEPHDLGDAEPNELLTQDLADVVQFVDLWFWGNTHYCALYDRSPKTPYIGSCIGHGGYPYDRIKPQQRIDHNRAGLNVIRFIETGCRFPEVLEMRPDRGNNGYVLMRLHREEGAIELQYIDWMRRLRHATRLERREGRLVFA